MSKACSRAAGAVAAALVLTVTSSASAQQDPEPNSASELRLHGGLNLRTDVGVHPIRADLGVQWGAFDGLLVLDPMFWTDGQTNTDLLLQWRFGPGVAALAGWRLTTVPLLQGSQMQQNLLLGAAADLPKLAEGWLGGQAGVELAATMLKHGGGLPPEPFSLASTRHFVDLLNLSLFLRLEASWGPL